MRARNGATRGEDVTWNRELFVGPSLVHNYCVCMYVSIRIEQGQLAPPTTHPPHHVKLLASNPNHQFPKRFVEEATHRIFVARHHGLFLQIQQHIHHPHQCTHLCPSDVARFSSANYNLCAETRRHGQPMRGTFF